MNARPHKCPSCEGELLTVSIEMGDGQVIFRTCPACDLRWWEKGGSSISRDAALTDLPRR
jgi:uncharacterized protein with PIN domain